jgi:hypothetical protein
VIDACAEPRLRAALDAAMSDDAAELEAALEALDAEKENRNKAEKEAYFVFSKMKLAILSIAMS